MAFLEALPLLCESRASLNPQSLVQQTGREEPEQKAPVARGTLGGAGREAEAWLPLAPCLPPTYKPRMGKACSPKVSVRFDSGCAEGEAGLLTSCHHRCLTLAVSSPSLLPHPLQSALDASSRGGLDFQAEPQLALRVIIIHLRVLPPQPLPPTRLASPSPRPPPPPAVQTFLHACSGSPKGDSEFFFFF